MISFTQFKDVSTSAAAGLFCGAVGSVAMASRFLRLPLWPLSAWSLDFLLAVGVTALACAWLFGLVAWFTIPPDEKHEGGTEIHKL